MKIVHVSRSDIAGGAALAAYRLHAGLRALGADSTMLVEEKFSRDESVREARVDDDLRARLRRNLTTRQLRRDSRRWVRDSVEAPLFSDDRGVFGADLARQLPADACVTLHWVARFVDLARFFHAAGPRRSYIWRLADMNPFTGGCHYDEECGRFRVACGHCPMLLRPSSDDLSHRVWRRRRDALSLLRDDQLHVVAISTWSADRACSSSLLGRFPVSVIPPGVDTTVFTPVDKMSTRRQLGIPDEACVLVYSAHVLDKPLKGADLLVAALAGMPPHPGGLYLLTVGYREMPRVKGPVTHIHLGGGQDPLHLIAAYAGADLAVVPSRQEAFGQVVIEALACGVPVVGFRTGGVVDAVVDGETGFMAPDMTAESLRETLVRALADLGLLRGMRDACREVAVRRFSADVVAARYLSLYASLAAEGPRAPGLRERLR